jgi:hypothetical protein
MLAEQFRPLLMEFFMNRITTMVVKALLLLTILLWNVVSVGAQTRTTTAKIDFEEYGGSTLFATTQTVRNCIATISGGELLSQATNLPVNQTVVYGTAANCSGCQPTITIDFDVPVSNFSLFLMNGDKKPRSYLIKDDLGAQQMVTLAPNFQSGATTVMLPSSGIRKVTITDDFSDTFYDFLIDNIQFDFVSTSIGIAPLAPNSCSADPITIEQFKVVPKNGTISFNVTINPSPTPNKITLNLKTKRGTGEAVFTSNNSPTLQVDRSGAIEIKGIQESSTTDNIELSATIPSQRKPLASLDFTVLFVKITMRGEKVDGATNVQVSNDNDAASAYNFNLGTLNLKTFKSSGAAAKVWRTGVEFVGEVIPKDYKGMIILQRDIVEARTYSDMAESAGRVTAMRDKYVPELHDNDPYSGRSRGMVYDLDAPSLGSTSATPVNAIRRIRTNFQQYAVIMDHRGKELMVSDFFYWYSRISIQKVLTPDGLSTEDKLYTQPEVIDDNEAGKDFTDLGWDLKSGFPVNTHFDEIFDLNKLYNELVNPQVQTDGDHINEKKPRLYSDYRYNHPARRTGE